MGTVENPATALVDGITFKVSGQTGMEQVAPNSVFVPATHFVSHAGSGALAAASGLPGWALDTTSDETVAAVVKLPDSWTAFDAAVLWSNGSTGAGGCRWDIGYGNVVAGDTPAAGGGTTASATGTASTTQYLLVQTDVVDGGALTAGEYLHVEVNRDADHAGDTMANDALLHGVLFTRVVG